MAHFCARARALSFGGAFLQQLNLRYCSDAVRNFVQSPRFGRIAVACCARPRCACTTSRRCSSRPAAPTRTGTRTSSTFRSTTPSPWACGCRWWTARWTWGRCASSQGPTSTANWRACRSAKLAAGLGYNTVRVFLQFMVWEADPEGHNERLETFLRLADAAGISMMPILFDDCRFDDRDPTRGARTSPSRGCTTAAGHRAPATPPPTTRRAGHLSSSKRTSATLRYGGVRDVREVATGRYWCRSEDAHGIRRRPYSCLQLRTRAVDRSSHSRHHT